MFVYRICNEHCGLLGRRRKFGQHTPFGACRQLRDCGGGAKSYDGHLTLSWLNAGIKAGGDYTADDWGRFWLDTLNVDFDITAATMDASDWDERLHVWINSDDMPDVSSAQFSTASCRAMPRRTPFTACRTTGKSAGPTLREPRKTYRPPHWRRKSWAEPTSCTARYSRSTVPASA